MGHKWCHCTWTRSSPTPSSWKGLDAKMSERWTVVVPRGWRARDEMTPSQSGSRRAGYDSALADQANSARLCSSVVAKACPMVDVVWLVFLSPFSGCGLGLAGSGCQICHDEDSMRSCRRTLRGRSVGGWKRASPAHDRKVLASTGRYIGLQNGAEPEATS